MRKGFNAAALGLLVLSLLAAGLPQTAQASSHREAPFSSGDPLSDATDVYAFRDPVDPSRVTLIANFIPFQDPSGGPNFFRFDDTIRYAIRIDNNGDAVTDIEYRFQFRTETRNPDSFLYNTGPVTSLDDPDLNIRQFYTVSVVRNPGATNETITPITPPSPFATSGFPVPPVNIGPRSTPNYETQLAQPAVLTGMTGTGVPYTVFAGQREEGFFIDVASIFDLLALRPFNSFHVIPGGDRALTTAPGVDALAGKNVSSIAIQVPISAITANGSVPTNPITDLNAVLGIYSASSRLATTTFASDRSGSVAFTGDFIQVSRLGNPLINEVIVPLRFKDRFNASLPGGDMQFLDAVLRPEIARLLDSLYGAAFDVPAEPRNDIATVFLTGIPAINQTPSRFGAPARYFPNQPLGIVPNERLRLNVAYMPTGAANTAGTPNRLGALVNDFAGFPNGRRVGDDVVDIELRVLAGVLFRDANGGAPFNRAPNNQLGDGVNENDRPFLTRFPYLGIPNAGYDAPGARIASIDTNAPADPQPAPTPRP